MCEKYGWYGIKPLRQVSGTNKEEYQELNRFSKSTATRELTNLVRIGILKRTGKGKRGIRYLLK